ncbi:MAG: beta strand repeat-containing protein, partial [Burkholderiaceae bacterium]
MAFGGYTITGSNLPTSYNASGLPPGLSINTSTGVISGTPTAAGNYSATISAINSSGTGSATLPFSIALSTPVITSASTKTGATGVALSYTITANSSPTSFNATGLPSGLTINTATGVISGTPTANGSTPVTISASNATGTGSTTLTINISLSAPTITSSLTASGATGVVFSGYTITATNTPTSYNATGLPPGLNINTSTGAISGTPTTNGIYNTSISATNATATDTQTLVFTIALSAPSINSSLTASGATGVVFGGYTITATNSPTSFNATGLPPGLSVNTSTGVISGTPTLNGTYNTSISATNATSTDSKTLVFTIALSAPAITSTLTASGATGVAFGGYTITASNFPTSFGASSLPPGLSINTATGVISGTPTLNGTFNSTITATNATATDSKTLVFTIALSAPAITSAATASGTTGSAFSYQITASNLPTSYAASGLPAGVSVNTGTGLISGTPTAGGAFNASVSATNATATANQAVTITIGFSPPTAGPAPMTVPVNTATTLNLLPFITGFTGFTVSGISVATQ